ncbi:MAG: hypothetical protein HYS14_08110, partial [Candidatus Rokubacteria bacterium]|nr:hypothetical protein [Candidatus Rokubacteria bacterium]
ITWSWNTSRVETWLGWCATRERCPRCHRLTLTPWILRRDRERRVWRRWVCIECQAMEERLENESA